MVHQGKLRMGKITAFSKVLALFLWDQRALGNGGKLTKGVEVWYVTTIEPKQ